MLSIEQETEPLVQRQETRYLLEENRDSEIRKLLEDRGFPSMTTKILLPKRYILPLHL